MDKTKLQQKVDALQHLEKEIAMARKDKEVAVKEMELAKSLHTSIDFEFEMYKEKTKKREQELLDLLNESRQPPDEMNLSDKMHDIQVELKRFEVVSMVMV